MKQLRPIFLLGLFVGLFGLATAQETPESALEFNEVNHDFGQLQKGDPAVFRFVFTNKTDEPVKLTNVKASCGCTTPTWTREPVAPGEQGEIDVRYNSNRVGRFTKSITVFYDEETPQTQILYIRGEVLSPPPSDDEIYSQPQGSLSFDKLIYNTGSFPSDQDREVTFLMKNTSERTMNLETAETPDFASAELSANSLEPGQKAELRVRVSGNYFETSQNFNDKIILRTDDPAGQTKELSISGAVERVFSADELAAMPNIEFERTEFSGKQVIAGEKLTVTYRFTNTGGSELIIDNVRASCGCTATSPKDRIIAPGESSEITATFDSRGRSGMQRKSITVTTNDPDQPNVILRLEAEVVSDPFHMGSKSGLSPRSN